MDESHDVYDYGYCVRFYQGCSGLIVDYPRGGISGMKGQQAAQADVMGFNSESAAKIAGMSYAVEQANAYGYVCMEPEKDGIVDVATIDGQRLFNVALLCEPVKQFERKTDDKSNKSSEIVARYNLPRRPTKRFEVEMMPPVREDVYGNELTM